MIGHNLRLLLVLLGLGTSWRLCLFFDRSFWSSLVAGARVSPETAWLAFSIALYSSMCLGLFLFRERRKETVMSVFAAATVALLLLMRIFPVLQFACLSHVLFGICSGFFYTAIILYAALGIPPEGRIKATAIGVGVFSVLVFLWLFFSPRLDFDLKLALLAAAISAPALLLRSPIFALGQKKAAHIAAPSPFPAKLLAATGITVFTGYFVNYLNQSGFGVQSFLIEAPGMAWLGFSVRILSCLAFVAFGQKLKIVNLLYACQGLTVLSFALSMLKLGSDLPQWLVYNLTNIAGSMLIYCLLAAVVAKYLYRFGPLAFLALSPGTGIVLGYLASKAASRFFMRDPGLYYSIPLVVICLLSLLLPFLVKAMEKELDLDRGESPGFLVKILNVEPTSQPLRESDIIRRRDRVAESLVSLNSTFDKEFRLTSREMEIAAYLAERFDYESIAEQLFISINTLKVHVKNIYRKYDVPNRKTLVELVESRIGEGAAQG